MKVADLLKISSESMKVLSKFDIRIDDYKYLDLFSDYEAMAAGGYKTTCAVIILAERYSISEATVYRVIRKLKATV